jgi:hypothetical protein
MLRHDVEELSRTLGVEGIRAGSVFTKLRTQQDAYLNIAGRYQSGARIQLNADCDAKLDRVKELQHQAEIMRQRLDAGLAEELGDRAVRLRANLVEMRGALG